MLGTVSRILVIFYQLDTIFYFEFTGPLSHGGGGGWGWGWGVTLIGACTHRSTLFLNADACMYTKTLTTHTSKQS